MISRVRISAQLDDVERMYDALELKLSDKMNVAIYMLNQFER